MHQRCSITLSIHSLLGYFPWNELHISKKASQNNLSVFATIIRTDVGKKTRGRHDMRHVSHLIFDENISQPKVTSTRNWSKNSVKKICKLKNALVKYFQPSTSTCQLTNQWTNYGIILSFFFPETALPFALLFLIGKYCFVKCFDCCNHKTAVTRKPFYFVSQIEQL